MKKYPRCLNYDDDSVRFCKKCNTELFFEDRFPGGGKKIVQKATLLGLKCTSLRPAKKSLKFKIKFLMSKIMHAQVLKKEQTPGADNQYWIDKGWLKPKTK